MLRLISAVVIALSATLAVAQSAAADTRVGPPLEVSIYQYAAGSDTPDTATIDIFGVGCLPRDAPASVLVTVDRLNDQVFTATPDTDGTWDVEIPIATPVTDTYTINASCDNYFGTTTYPQAQAGPDDVINVVALPAAGHGVLGQHTSKQHRHGGELAATGSRTTAEVAIGLAALVLGGLFVWLGRPRRRGVHAA